MEYLYIYYTGLLLISVFIAVNGWKLYLVFQTSKYLKQNPKLRQRILFPKPILYSISLIFALVSIFLMLFSLKRTKPNEIEIAKEYKSVDILFVIDVSLSMNSVDVSPSRLHRFKDMFKRLLPELTGNRIGMIVFAGQSFSYCPLTIDTAAVSDYIDSLAVEMVGKKGTDLANALEKTNRVIEKQNTYRNPIIVIVSDGEDHENGKLVPLNGSVFVWGVGTLEGGPVEFRDPSTGNGGYVTMDGGITDSISDRTIHTQLNENRLIELAELNRGKYFNISFGEEAGEQLIAAVNETEKSSFKNLKNFQKEDGAYILLSLAILFFFAERVISLLSNRNFKITILSILTLFLYTNTNPLLAWELDPGGNAVKKGNSAFERGNFAESLENYEEAETYFPSDPRLEFNKGGASYKIGNYNESLENYKRILENKNSDEEIKTKTYFNMGNTYLKLGDKKKALQSYSKALELDPNHLASKKNIEFLRKKEEKQSNKQEPNSSSANDIKDPKQKGKESSPKRYSGQTDGTFFFRLHSKK